MTNGERAERLVGEARQIAGEMRRALDEAAWNLATRRAQEVLELVIKALLNEMGVLRYRDSWPLFLVAIGVHTMWKAVRRPTPPSAPQPGQGS